MSWANSWQMTTLGALCAESGGGVQTGPFGSQLHAADYVAVGVPSVMPQNIGDNTISADGIAIISDADAERLSKYRLRTGDIVYSRRGDVEKRAYVRPEHDGWLCGTGCLRVRLGEDAPHDSRFISYQLGTEERRAWIVRHAVGATMPNLNTAILSGVPISAPPLSEQQAIAEVLGALDNKIAANTGIVTTTDALAASLTRSVLDMTKQVALNEIALITMGSSPPGTSYNEVGQGTVFYQGVRDFGVRYPTNRVWTSEPVRMAKAGDCLLSVRAPVGQLNLSGEDTCIGRGLASVRSRAARPMTLFHLLRDAPEAWAPYEAEGTIFGSINKTQLETLRLPAVSEDLAEGLERELDALENSVASRLYENVKLAAMRDALLPRLMSGMIRVEDAEQMVGDVV